MIKNLKIKNFQAHANLELELHDGINIIVGPSDKGKSSVLRAVDLVRENRPSGFAYRHDPRLIKKSSKKLPDSELTSVEIELDDGNIIARERNNKGINQYRINDEVLKALRSDVPEEVSKLLNIAPYSVQSQHNPYFLLNDSDGEVSRQINDLVGLEAIDLIQKRVNSIVSDAKQRYEYISSEIVDIEKDIDSIKDLDKINAYIFSIDTSIKQKEVIDNSIEELSELIENLQELNDELEAINVVVGLEKTINELKGDVEYAVDLRNDIYVLQKELATLIEYEKELEQIDKVLTHEDRILAINEKLSKSNELSESIKALQYLSDKISEYEKECYNEEVRLKEATERYVKALKEAGKCPTCGNIVKDSEIESIL